MAVKRYTIDGKGQIEINNCAFRRNGNVEAQCKLNADAENGMILAVDKPNGLLKLPVASEAKPMAILYNTEASYDDQNAGLKNYEAKRDSYGRVGYLIKGDLFRTNCICYDTSVYADDSAVDSALAGVATTSVYGTNSTLGAIQLVATKPVAGEKLQVVKKTTMPDGSFGVQFIALG